MGPAILFGLDGGNSQANGVIGANGNNRMLTIPAEIGAGQLRDLQRIRGGAGAKGRLASGEYVLEVDGASFFVGRLALEQSAEASSARGDVSRYWSGHTLRLLMVQAGALIKEPSFTLRVVTGLPIQIWDATATVPRVQQSLCGTHAFRLNGHTRVMSVEAVLVVMEGAGALAAHGVADDVPQAVIDTGGRTTNLFWAQGQRPMLPRCAGFARGVGDIADALAAWFLDHYGRELTPIERRDILWSYTQRQPHRSIFVDGTPVELERETRRMIAEVGTDIRSQVSRIWRSSEHGKVAAEAARVLYVGGGAYYFAPLLRESIPALLVPKHPEVANAEGYLALGQQLSERVWTRLHPEERTMARPRKSAHVRRIELRLAQDDPLLEELVQEAKLRRVELTQHIHDLLRSRYLLRHGQSLHDLLWVPGPTTASGPHGEVTAISDALNTTAASAAAAVWSEMLETQE